MKLPINCPICGDVMMTTFEQGASSYSAIIKTCDKRLNHKIKIASAFTNNDLVRYINLEYDFNTKFNWLPIVGLLSLYVKGQYKERLPYFEPDFSDYPKLLNRLKTCLVFS